MKTLLSNDLSAVSGGGGEPFYVDVGQFVGAYAKSLIEHAFFGVFAGTFAFCDAIAYATKE